MWPFASASATLIENLLRPDGSGVDTAGVGGDVDQILELVGLVVGITESEFDRLHQLFLLSCELFLFFALGFLEGLLTLLLLLFELALLLQSLLLLLLQSLLLARILALEPLSCTLVG